MLFHFCNNDQGTSAGGPREPINKTPMASAVLLGLRIVTIYHIFHALRGDPALGSAPVGVRRIVKCRDSLQT
jgi:hypothetical protein